MKEDVVAANLANLRQSINELKVYIEKQNATVPKPELESNGNIFFFICLI